MNSRLIITALAMFFAACNANEYQQKKELKREFFLATKKMLAATNLSRTPTQVSRAQSSIEGALGSWQTLTNTPPFGGPFPAAGNPLLLTDGSVVMQNFNGPPFTGEIWKLTPDEFGNYVNGTWTQLASLPAGYAPLYHASAVLADGRLIFEGGELNGPNYDEVWTNLGAIYDPVTNIWTPVNPPTFFGNIFQNGISTGDASSVVLPNGTFMLADSLSYQAALLDSKNLTWTETNLYDGRYQTKSDPNNEEGWTLLPNGKVLTVNTYVFPGINPPYPPNPTNSELYNPKTGTWSTAGSTPVTLTDTIVFEMGPAVLRPNGTVFCPRI